jgi:ribosome-associated toxin RatA of RatAB toxin-antitoxin module
MTGTSTTSKMPTTRHEIIIAAPAKVVYDLIADVTKWPYTFGPTVHAEVFETQGATQRLRLWAFANGAVRTWTSQRLLDAKALTVHFEQERSAAPVTVMGGAWLLEAVTESVTKVSLLHHFRTATPDTTDLVLHAVYTNSKAELAALKSAAEYGDEYDRLVLTFSDSLAIAAPRGKVYDFLHRADLWPHRLPHVTRLVLTEDVTGVQSMEMDTLSTDGSVHTTQSVRVCFPNDMIVYKQIAAPEIMAAHVGRWDLRDVEGGVEATSHHTVVIRLEMVANVLGPQGTVERARELIRAALGANSLTTLRCAKAATEHG